MERVQFGNGLWKVGIFLVMEREKMVTTLNRKKKKTPPSIINHGIYSIVGNHLVELETGLMNCGVWSQRGWGLYCGKILKDSLKNLVGIREAMQGFDCRNDIISSAKLTSQWCENALGQRIWGLTRFGNFTNRCQEHTLRFRSVCFYFCGKSDFESSE